MKEYHVYTSSLSPYSLLPTPVSGFSSSHSLPSVIHTISKRQAYMLSHQIKYTAYNHCFNKPHQNKTPHHHIS